MKTTISFYDFRREFEQCRPDNFSAEGLAVLFAYFEELEESMGEEIELDVIAICCDYCEETPEEIARNYSIDLSDCGGDYYEISEAVKAYLEENTQLVGETSTGFVYLVF